MLVFGGQLGVCLFASEDWFVLLGDFAEDILRSWLHASLYIYEAHVEQWGDRDFMTLDDT